MAYATTPPAAFESNPFDTATTLAETTQQFVVDQLGYIQTNILTPSITDLSTALTNLGTFEVPIPDDIQFLDPNLTPEFILDWNLSDIDTATFGSISPYPITDPPDATGLPDVTVPEIPDFVPSITGIVVPPPPGPGVIAEPGDVPSNPGFTYPDAPDVTLPDSPSLWAFTPPAAPEIVLPTLDLADFPTLSEMNIDTFIDWDEPNYTGEVWDNIKTQIITFLAGGTGIRPDVEEAIVNRGRDREDRILRQQIQEAIDEWANRGYTSPPGMLAKRIDTIREQGTLNKLGLQREVVIKAMEEELANLRFACQQGIAGEQLFVQIHLAAVNRLFEVQRLHIQGQIELYNLAVQIYSARLQENVIRAQVYEVQVRAALAEIEVFKALIEAESLKADINRSLVEAYRAEIEAREAIVSIYTAQVQAVRVQAEVFATEVGAYRAEVEAFATRVDADKTRFEAYETQIRGEAVKADIIRSEAQAYQAQIGGIEAAVRAQVAALEGAISEFRATVEAYDVALRNRVAQNQNELAQIQANVEGHRVHTQRFIAEAGVEQSAKELEATVWQTTNQISLQAYEAEIERLRVIMEKAIQESALILDAIKASGDLSSTISAGALAALHVGATMSGSGGVNASGSQNLGYSLNESFAKSCSVGESVNINYESDVFPGTVCDILVE